MFYHQLEITGQIHNQVLSLYSTLLSVDETLMVSVGVRASVAFWYQASINESSAYYEKSNGDSIFPADSDLAGIPPWLKRVFRDAIGILTGGAAGILVAGGAVALEIITAGAATPIIAGAVPAAGGAASAK